MELRSGPKTASTLSWETSFVTAFTPPDGVPWSSAVTTSIWRPMIPPVLLTLSTAMLSPSRADCAFSAVTPLIPPTNPTLNASGVGVEDELVVVVAGAEAVVSVGGGSSRATGTADEGEDERQRYRQWLGLGDRWSISPSFLKLRWSQSHITVRSRNFLFG